jgi:ABC-type uncharacterized transport system ATPase subunit
MEQNNLRGVRNFQKQENFQQLTCFSNISLENKKHRDIVYSARGDALLTPY